ncbi:28S ribosomal protein S9, mitochondrial [Anthonomus grandis grandis]|uniref:28S ribosomal protein S9, mitochondrial n=1 Tax=Anthonomus grandis grandis TaxID=2921223 RepID=UPI002165C1DA|nr:28S ribosomal protein S9, mitochondrial [Anthonomus grandis grandis]
MFRRINVLIDPIKSLHSQGGILLKSEVRLLSTHTQKLLNSASAETTNATSAKNTVSKAMRAYLQRAQEHDEFMKAQRHEFEIGKRHLANMMGENPETFTQEDIDNAIEYLFPSGLYEKKARPMMKPPEEVFPQRKAAEFDETGRPYHYLFYTSRPNFYGTLHEAVQHIIDLNKFEDNMLKKNLLPDPNLALQLSGSRWVTKEQLEKKLVETLTDKEYASFINVMERLASLPYSYKAKDLILSHREDLMSHTETYEAIKAQIGEDGRQFVTVYECRRKRAIGNVTLRVPGTGKISINGKDINYFEGVQEKEQIFFPLIFTNMQGKVDIEAEVAGGGPSGQAGAIRWGISWGLRSFIDQEVMEKMRLAGLLSYDVRRRERKKPGQEGARKKFTWKKR